MIIAEDQTRVTNNNNSNRCGRNPPNQTIVNGDLYINLEGSSSSMVIKSLTTCLVVLCSVILFRLFCYMNSARYVCIYDLTEDRWTS